LTRLGQLALKPLGRAGRFTLVVKLSAQSLDRRLRVIQLFARLREVVGEVLAHRLQFASLLELGLEALDLGGCLAGSLKLCIEAFYVLALIAQLGLQRLDLPGEVPGLTRRGFQLRNALAGFGELGLEPLRRRGSLALLLELLPQLGDGRFRLLALLARLREFLLEPPDSRGSLAFSIESFL
jgi:hypothetical protein